MRLLRRFRFATAVVALFSMLFMQLALASYDCPQLASALEQAVAMQGMDKGTDCVQVDEQSPNLCQAHGQAKSQSFEMPAQLSAPPFVPGPLLLALPVIEAPPIAANQAVPSSFLQSANSTPAIAIRHCCLRN